MHVYIHSVQQTAFFFVYVLSSSAISINSVRLLGFNTSSAWSVHISMHQKLGGPISWWMLCRLVPHLQELVPSLSSYHTHQDESTPQHLFFQEIKDRLNYITVFLIVCLQSLIIFSIIR